MRLSSIRLTRFKAFEELEIDLAPVTVLIGKNNAGKSTVLHALALLAQSANATSHRTPPECTGDLVDLGPGPSGLVHGSVVRSDAETGWGIGLEWEGMSQASEHQYTGHQFDWAVKASIRAQCRPPYDFQNTFRLEFDIP